MNACSSPVSLTEKTQRQYIFLFPSPNWLPKREAMFDVQHLKVGFVHRKISAQDRQEPLVFEAINSTERDKNKLSMTKMMDMK